MFRWLHGSSTNSAYQITDVYGLQGLASPSGSLLTAYAELVNNINATGTATWNPQVSSPSTPVYAGLVPIGNSTTPYTGTFNGQGYTINNLYINLPSASYVGLFGDTGSGATIQNVGLTNDQVIGYQDVGSLVGYNDGTVETSYATGAVTGGSNSVCVGGLVGANIGTVEMSYATGAVTGGSGSDALGGLVGANIGMVETSYATGAVSGSIQVGGLVGASGGPVETSYATGAVSGSIDVGGLVGANDNNSSVQTCYATGAVSGFQSVGGLVGWNGGTIITASFWDTSTAGVTLGVGSDPTNTTPGVTGDPTATLMTASTYSGAGWSIGTSLSDTWVILTGQTRPMLSMEYSTAITNAHQLQLIGLNSTTLAANYTLANNIDLSGVTNPSDVWGTSTTSGAGFVPIGNAATNYYGTFNGQGYTINNLYINTPSANYVGLFGVSAPAATIENVGLTNDQVSGGSEYVGSLVGWNQGTVETSYATGAVTGGSSASAVGGLVGSNSGTVEMSYATGDVSGSSMSAGWWV